MDSLVLIGAKWINEIFNSLWLAICSGIYSFIGLLYQVFEKVSSVNLFNQEIFDKITGRLYIVIAIAMLFIFAYNIILAIVNPDGKDKGLGGLGKSVKETIISLVLIVLLPTIFNYLYVFQTHVLESNVIGTVILGGVGSTAGHTDLNGNGEVDPGECESGDYDCTCDFSGFDLENYNNDAFWFWESDHTDMSNIMQNACIYYRDRMPDSQRGAYSIAPTIFSAFYRPSNYSFTDCVNYLNGTDTGSITRDKDKKICVNYFTDVTLSKYTGNIMPFVGDEYLKGIVSEDNNDSIQFDWLMAIIAGVLAIYMFFCYAMEVGVRVAKLGFLQLISPIPVMMRIIPGQKEKTFDKWFNHLKNAYLDVFIRLIIIYFTLFAVGLVPDVIETMWTSIWDGSSVSDSGILGGITNFVVKMFVTVFVILGLLKFAQEAPALLKEFFSGAGGGNFALRSPKKQLQENKLAMGGIGAIGGAVSTGVGNFGRSRKSGDKFGTSLRSSIGGFGAGMVRGAKEGYKTNNFDNMGTAIGRAKADSDKKYFSRRDKKEAIDSASNKYITDPNSVLNVIGGNIRGRADLIGNDLQQTYRRWSGNSAMNETMRNANGEVKGYASGIMDFVDSQTKKLVANLEQQRDQEIKDAKGQGPEKIQEIKDRYSAQIDTARISAIKDMLTGKNASGMDVLRSSIDNLCESLKNNQNYLEHISGEGGALQNSIVRGMDEGLEKSFGGSVDDYANKMMELVSDTKTLSDMSAQDQDKFNSTIKAMLDSIDKTAKTANNNITGIANGAKKSDKK